MSEQAQLEKALTKLRKDGREVGTPSTFGEETVIQIDGVLMTLPQIFQLAEISPKG